MATDAIIVTVHADGSTDSKELGRFVDVLARGADFAKRFGFLGNAGNYDMPHYRQLGNWSLLTLTNAIFGAR